LLGGLLSLPLIAVSYLGSQLAGLPFIPFDLFDWLARVLPGPLVIGTIETMVKVIVLLHLGAIDTAAKSIEQAEGILLIVVICAVIGAVLAWALQSGAGRGWRAGLLAGVVLLAGFAIVEFGLNGGRAVSWGGVLWLAILSLAWGGLLGWLVTWPEAVGGAEPHVEADGGRRRVARRTFLVEVAGGAAVVTLVAGGLGRLLAALQAAPATQALAPSATPPATPLAAAGQAATSAALPSAGAHLPTPSPVPTPSYGGLAPAVTPAEAATTRDRVPPASGTRPELTDNSNFYRIDIDDVPPAISLATWVVEVKGLFDRPGTLTLADLMALPSITQPVTESCISNPVAGDLIGTSDWTGVRLRDVLAKLGLKPGAQALAITSADGFYESVSLPDMMDPRTLLVYLMNGQSLPVEHGFPLRIYIPNRYGMKQPKWIISIEATGSSSPGYWVDRGWDQEARPQIVSVIDTVAKDHVANGMVPVGGIAWAGDRGIQKVEVQVDGGAWTEAILRVPPLSGLTWVQWRYDWPLVKGHHTFTVRATDGTGTLQNSAVHDTFPLGATGYHSASTSI
jgi:DMSO/TMAO reductase YedYZ molybdopterin-dependent catalytic subunit